MWIICKGVFTRNKGEIPKINKKVNQVGFLFINVCYWSATRKANVTVTAHRSVESNNRKEKISQLFKSDYYKESMMLFIRWMKWSRMNTVEWNECRTTKMKN